jgi:hypothetical protein
MRKDGLHRLDSYWAAGGPVLNYFAGTILHEISHGYAGTRDDLPRAGEEGPSTYYFEPGLTADLDQWNALGTGAGPCTPSSEVRCMNASALQFFAKLLYEQLAVPRP